MHGLGVALEVSLRTRRVDHVSHPGESAAVDAHAAEDLECLRAVEGQGHVGERPQSYDAQLLRIGLDLFSDEEGRRLLLHQGLQLR